MTIETKVSYRGATRNACWEGTKARANKSVLQGNMSLVEGYTPNVESIQGTDFTVLESPLVQVAFDNLLKQFRPGYRIALVSLCTASRPYSKSRKWVKLVSAFSDKADLIIMSNAGIIPIEFDCHYPYLNYNGHGPSSSTPRYVELGIERMKRFFTKHNYDHVLFHFRPNMRERQIVEVVAPWAVQRGYIKNYICLPNEEQYEASRAEGFVKAGFKMYPELWPRMWDPVEQWVNDKHAELCANHSEGGAPRNERGYYGQE